MRFDVVTKRRGGDDRRQLAEEVNLLAFEGSPDAPEWLDDERATGLVAAEPSGNVGPDQARGLVSEVVDAYGLLRSELDKAANQRAGALLDAHTRVREGARLKGVQYEVESQPPVDVLGAYVLLPRPSL
jgi:hypothetical protein